MSYNENVQRMLPRNKFVLMLGRIFNSFFATKIKNGGARQALFSAPLEEAELSVVPSAQISHKQVNVENDPAFLEFLSKFAIGNAPETFQSYAPWQSVLRMSVQAAIDLLVTEDFLEKSNLATALTCRGAAQLKALAKEVGVSSSGRKDQIAERLVQTNSDAVKRLAAEFNVFSCTEKGLAAVRRFQERVSSARSQAETLVIEALRLKHLKEACRLTASYEATQVFARGSNMDWKNYNDAHDMETLRIIFETKPDRFASINDLQLKEVRVTACMLHLWGLNDPSRWLIHSDAKDFGMEPDDAAKLLLNYALNMKRLAECQQAGINKVQILGGCDDCPACQKVKDQIFALADVPEVPLSNCICEGGCTCTIAALS